MHEYRYLQSPEEDTRSSGARVTGGTEQPTWALGMVFVSSDREVHALHLLDYVDGFMCVHACMRACGQRATSCFLPGHYTFSLR